jgi:hypothetical protein
MFADKFKDTPSCEAANNDGLGGISEEFSGAENIERGAEKVPDKGRKLPPVKAKPLSDENKLAEVSSVVVELAKDLGESLAEDGDATAIDALAKAGDGVSSFLSFSLFDMLSLNYLSFSYFRGERLIK